MKNTLSTAASIDYMSNFECFYEWSFNAIAALVEYLEEYEKNLGEEIEIDPIAFACEWSSYETREEAHNDYGLHIDDEELEDYTTVIEHEGGIVIMHF